jgi:hypothetical protein
MKAWVLMLAIVPLLPPPLASPGVSAPPCAIAIAVDVRAPLAWGDTEWHLFTREVERTWAAYGVSFCWMQGPDRCEGIEVRVRVLIANDLPSLDTSATKSSLGRIRFVNGAPLGEIELSISAASQLSSQARLGDRPVGSWPGVVGASLLPRVLGRGLAHEIGHFVLRSREHASTGLMASGFTPEEAVWGGPSRFTLSKNSAHAVRSECTARRMAAR